MTSARRGTAILTSGRRRPNPRTYASMSMASRPGPDDGTDRADISSVKIAGSRDDAPYTAPVERTMRLRTLSERWQAASNCMVPRTFISLAMLRAADDAGVEEAD